MDELILKFLEKQTDPSEEMLLRRWIENSNSNLYYFRFFFNSWQECRASGNTLLFDCIAAIH